MCVGVNVILCGYNIIVHLKHLFVSAFFLKKNKDLLPLNAGADVYEVE